MTKPKAKKPATIEAPATVGKPSDVTATRTNSACPKCTSTERTPYTNRRELAHGGLNRDGSPFTHVIWQNTTCSACGQARTDRSTENRPSENPS
jgi:ribosomal protein S27AE